MNIALTKKSNFILYILLGITLGIILFMTIDKPNQWTWFIFASMVMAWFILVNPNQKLFFLFILALVVPFNSDIIFNYRFHPGGAKGWTISLIDIPLIALYLLWLFENLNHQKKSINWFPAFTVPFFGFISISLLSLLQANYVELGLFQILLLIKRFLLVFYIANQVNDERTVKWILIALFLGCLLQSGIGLAQYMKGGKIGLYLLGERPDDIDLLSTGAFENLARVTGTFWHSNGFAFYLQMIIPLGIGVILLGSNGTYRISISILMIFGFIVLILTLSRGAWLSFIVSILYLVWHYLKRIRVKISSLFPRLLVAMIILLLAALLFGSTIYDRFVIDDYGSAESRVPMMKTALNIISHHPIIGIGINNYAETMIQYDVTGNDFSLYRPVHNLFLLIAAESGLIGLICFAWALIAAMRMGMKALKNKNNFNAGIIIGMVAGLLGLIGHAQVDFVLLDCMNIFWIYLGLLCALSNKIDLKINY
jgi:putative inorganic carbon (HCO3(-)) transporter